MKYTIRVYATQDGELPYTEWLRGLKDATTKGVIRLRVDKVERGTFGHVEPVGEGVSELKIDFGPGYQDR